MLPQLGRGGWMPMPRKLRADSLRIAKAAAIVAEIVIDDVACGRQCLRRTRRCDAPMDRAASTNSSERAARISLRTTRAVGIHEVQPITSTMVAMVGGTLVRKISHRKNSGMAM